MPFEVINLDTDESHGVYESHGEARGCVEFDGLKAYSIWRGYVEDGEFFGTERIECCEADYVDPENIYGLASIRQSIEEDRKERW